MKKLGKHQCMRDRLLLLAAILARWRQPVASVVAPNLLYQVMRLVSYQRIAMAIKTTREYGNFCWLMLCLLWPWQPLGQYGASRRPMAASSGFRYCPWHPPGGNALGIALSYCHGYRNCQQWRYICSSLPPLLFDQSVAKRPCYGLFKLTPSHNINLISVIRIFLFYWP